MCVCVSCIVYNEQKKQPKKNAENVTNAAPKRKKRKRLFFNEVEKENLQNMKKIEI